MKRDSNRVVRFSCLKCGLSDHGVRRCPQAQAGEAERLLAAKRKGRESQEKRPIVQLVTSKCNEDSGFVNVTVEDCCSVSALLDSGADCALISAGLVEKVQRLYDFVKMKALKNPEIIGTLGRVN